MNRFGDKAPRLILILCLVLTLAVTGYVRYSILRENTIRFEALTDDLTDQVRDRLERYQNALIQTRALFLIRPSISRRAFRDYIDGLGLFETYPGIQGIGYVARVQAGDLASHVAAVRKEGFPDYRVWPAEPARETYFPIVYLEPFDWRNQRAFGFDMTSEPTRNNAMIRARDTGMPALSGMVKLVQETNVDTQQGFLLYVPLYDRSRPTGTAEQRRSALIGYIYSPYRALDFFKAIFERPAHPSSKIDIEIFSGNRPSPATLLYDPDGKPQNGKHTFVNGRIHRTIELNFSGAVWTLRYEALPGFVPASFRYAPLAVATLGVLLSLLFYTIARAILAQAERERQALKRIKASETRYELASRATKNAIWDWNLIEGAITWNEAIHTEYGYPREAMRTDSNWWHQNIHPEDRNSVSKGIHGVIDSRDQQHWSAEYRFRKADGSFAVVLDRGFIVRDENGKSVRMIGAMEDITERSRLAGELLLKSEALENSLNAFDIVDGNGRFIYVNRAYVRMWGYESAEEVLATSPASHCVDPTVPERIIGTLKQKGECEIEFQARRRDGSTFEVRMWARRSRDPQGREIYPTTSIDITEQVRLEKERRKATDQIQAALQERDRSLEILATINQVGQRLTAELDLEKLVQLVTDAATRISGAQFGAFFYNVTDEKDQTYTLYAISGAPREAFSKFPMPLNTAVFNPTFKGEGTVRSDDIRKDPRYGKSPPYYGMPEGHLPVTSYLAVSVISRSGEVLGGLFFGHEKPGIFTEQAERIVEGLASQAAVAMDNARLYRRLQESVRSRDEFLSIASHELKTPITSLKLQFQMAARRMARGDTEVFAENAVRKRVESVNRQLDRLASLIEDMLDVSRISLGKLSLSPELLDLNRVVQEVLDRFSEQAQTAGIDLRSELSSTAVNIRADRYRIEQVLDNLLTNAIKYGEGKPIRVSVDYRGDQAVIQVRDQGMGIARENLERIFQRFERAVSTSGISGLGIGLYICKQIVEAQGGTIRAESEPGKGSVFTVELPKAG